VGWKSAIVSGYVAFCQISMFSKIYNFHIIEKTFLKAKSIGFAGRLSLAGHNLDTLLESNSNSRIKLGPRVNARFAP